MKIILIATLCLSFFIPLAALPLKETWPSQSQLDSVCSSWGLGEDLTLIRKVANFVYSGTFEDREVFVRLTSGQLRHPSAVEAELHWMNDLREKGAPVVALVPNSSGELFEVIYGENSVYTVAVVEKAEGSPLDDYSSESMRAWGQSMGLLHRLSQEYKPPESIQLRPSWKYNLFHQDLEYNLDPDAPWVYEVFQAITSWAENLSKDQGDYGLIHADLHSGNFFINEGELSIFDFDDCCYHWYSYDVAVAISSILRQSSPTVVPENYSEILASFLEGYEREYPLHPSIVEHLDIWLLYRVALLCITQDAFEEATVLDKESEASLEEWKKWCEAYILAHMDSVLSQLYEKKHGIG